MTYLHQLYRTNPAIIRAELKTAARKARNGAGTAKCNFTPAELDCYVQAEGSTALRIALRRSRGRGVKAAEVETIVDCLGTAELAGCEMAPGRNSHDVWLVVRVTGPKQLEDA